MRAEQQTQSIQRILVALDASPVSLTALETAVDLAALFEAELLGLFVEDINLLRVTEFSFVQEIGIFSASRRRLEVRQVERQFRIQAGQARQALARLAEQSQVDWHFRVVRGAISAELLQAAAEADLLILGKVGWSRLSRRRLGSTTRAILARGAQLTLVLEQNVCAGQPLIVIYDGSATAQEGLEVATQLARSEGEPLTILVLADQAEAYRLQQEAENYLGQKNIEGRYRYQARLNIPELVHTVQRAGFRLLVMPLATGQIDQQTTLTLLSEIDCPVLLVR